MNTTPVFVELGSTLEWSSFSFSSQTTPLYEDDTIFFCSLQWENKTKHMQYSHLLLFSLVGVVSAENDFPATELGIGVGAGVLSFLLVVYSFRLYNNRKAKEADIEQGKRPSSLRAGAGAGTGTGAGTGIPLRPSAAVSASAASANTSMRKGEDAAARVGDGASRMMNQAKETVKGVQTAMTETSKAKRENEQKMEDVRSKAKAVSSTTFSR